MAQNTAVSKAEFERALQAAVDKRSRHYAQTFALAVRFELDDTKAYQDTEHFQTLLHAFDLKPAEEYILKKSDPMPGWTLKAHFMSLLRTASTTPGRSLILVHYAGHGKVDFKRQIGLPGQSKTPQMCPVR